MATKRKYAYYIKGNKIAIIEEGMGAGVCSLSGYNTQSACEDAGGTWTENASGVDDGEYRSPIQTITDGLEIQYAYSPSYRVSSNTTIEVNKFYINGWTVIGGYLTFLRSKENNIISWGNAPENAVTSGSAGDTGGQSLDYIVVKGSSRWDGLHRVQTAGTEGNLTTYTKVSKSLPYWEDQQVDFNTSEEIFDGGDGSLWLADYFSTDDYMWISGSGAGKNNGLFSISSVSTSNTAASSKITLGTRYSVANSSDSDSYSTGLNNEYSAAAALTGEADQTDINIYKAYRDFSYVLTDVDVLDDEEFELDLSRYQANAVVYYLKAKLAEDVGDMDKREFFMREFKRQLEKGASALKRGPYIVQGFKEMR